MRFFIRYAKQHRLGVGVFFLFGIIFLLVFLLYRLPAGAILYPAFLCAAIGLLFLIAIGRIKSIAGFRNWKGFPRP